jgi:hypothetical protein
MDLKEFVKETLTQIADGLKESNEYIKENQNGFIHKDYMNVKFDVAVTTSEEDKTGLGGKLSVANLISFGGKEENTNQNTNFSRVQFNVNVFFSIGDR